MPAVECGEARGAQRLVATPAPPSHLALAVRGAHKRVSHLANTQTTCLLERNDGVVGGAALTGVGVATQAAQVDGTRVAALLGHDVWGRNEPLNPGQGLGIREIRFVFGTETKANL